ncbi:uncharacterized protein [Coffea arabica]|uniref:Reverse transcriptase domain-containing protein n=1 Tax=Coffea arabica TaxID=13443 RepID=A0A6P6W4B2_COFAR
MYKLHKKVTNCRLALLKWKNNFQGNARKRIDNLKKLLEELKVCDCDDKKARNRDLRRQLKEAYDEEELFWSQKSRVQWLKEGDKNTHFFHSNVKGRRHRNKIQRLQREDTTWTTSKEEIGEEVVNQFKELFGSKGVTQTDMTLEGISQTISDHMNSELTQPVKDKEIKAALFSMNPTKTPGLDGMKPLFFQKFWHIVKNDIIKAIKSFFHSSHMLKAMNHTNISLIPKVENPTEVKQFRPITNRLKKVLGKCISTNQAAFVPGRQILDNVIKSHEYLHYLKNKREGSHGFMTLKLDMSKAYDRVEWGYLKEIMVKLGFCARWITWIMECITTAFFSFNINGEPKGYVIPSRGIRQGDPLSPYLFLLVSQGFSHLLDRAQRNKKLTGMRISRSGPSITHLFFADDSLIFCKADKRQAEEVRRILKIYEHGSRQVINMEKFSVFFSRNVEQNDQREIYSCLEHIKVVKQGKYLGLPMVITNTNDQIFGFIREKCNKTIFNWSNKQLSQAGKEVLLKAVTMAMPTYAMSCFKLPVKLCKDINAMMARFWWGEDNGKRKMHWCSWKKLSTAKNNGGLGFKDLQGFNKALLESNGIKRRGVGGVRKRIGNGKSTNIWEDAWLLDGKEGKVEAPKPLGCKITKVSELISNFRWKAPLIFRTFSPHEARNILKTSISVTSRPDRYFWSHSTNGKYTVRSAYEAFTKKDRQPNAQVSRLGETSWTGGSNKIWKQLWKMRITHKYKLFLWKSLHQVLPVREAIFRRTGKGELIYKQCGETNETVEHIFFQCNKAKLIWNMAPLQWDGLHEYTSDFRKWWSRLMEVKVRKDGMQHICLTVDILWHIWKSRNEAEFESKDRHPMEVVRNAVNDWEEYHQCLQVQQRMSISETEIANDPGELDRNILSIHVNVGQHMEGHNMGIGITATNGNNQIGAAWILRERSTGSVVLDNLVAIQLALCKLKEHGWQHIQVQTSCNQTLKVINCQAPTNICIAGHLECINDLSLMFRTCSFVSQPSNGSTNTLSYKLSKQAMHIYFDEEFFDPQCLSTLL